MKKETRAAAEAFLQYSRYIENSFVGMPPRFNGARTIVDKGEMLLHGHMIAWHHDKDVIAICLRGWLTKTAIDRLNGIIELAHFERPLFLRGGKVYYGTLAREIGKDEIVLLPRYLPQEVTDGAAA